MQNDIGTIIEDNKLVVKTKTEIISEVISTRLPNLPGFKEAQSSLRLRESVAEKCYEEKLLTKREYTTIKEVITFLKTAYIETEDMDGNIVKGDKQMVKKLKTLYKKLTHMFYDNREMVNKNMKQKRLAIEPIVEPLLKITKEKLVENI